jgi:curli biogenesis system outer membrane secretion channel CsgG
MPFDGHIARCAAAIAALALLPLAAAAQELGRAGSIATGGAGPNGAVKANSRLERCEAPKGTLAVVEPQSQVLGNLQRYGLGSPTSVLRMLVQQSNCFQVVERGVAMGNMMQERALARSGELQADANIGKGQMAVAASSSTRASCSARTTPVASAVRSAACSAVAPG